MDRHVDLLEIAKETDGFSGSDLKEMCRDAALFCVREYVNSTCEERYVFLSFVTAARLRAPWAWCSVNKWLSLMLYFW